MRPVGPVGAQGRRCGRLAGQGARRLERGQTRLGRHETVGTIRAGDGKGGNIRGGRDRRIGRAVGATRVCGIGG